MFSYLVSTVCTTYPQEVESKSVPAYAAQHTCSTYRAQIKTAQGKQCKLTGRDNPSEHANKQFQVKHSPLIKPSSTLLRFCYFPTQNADQR